MNHLGISFRSRGSVSTAGAGTTMSHFSQAVGDAVYKYRGRWAMGILGMAKFGNVKAGEYCEGHLVQACISQMMEVRPGNSRAVGGTVWGQDACARLSPHSLSHAGLTAHPLANHILLLGFGFLL